jgi:trigger factor
VKVTKESTGPTEVLLNIEMNADDQEPFIGRSYRRVASRVHIPGFRLGKAPRSIVESYIGRTSLLQEAAEFMIPETLNRVLKEEKLEAFIQPEIEMLQLEPFSFKAVVTLEPLVDLGDCRSIRLEREVVEITDAHVNEVLERLRHESARWEPVSRSAQFADLLTLDVTGTIDGENIVNDKGVDFVPREDNSLPLPGFSACLNGIFEGGEKEFTLTVPDNYPQASYAGKECHFWVKVSSIKEEKLPELDDEFAKGAGDSYESLEALQFQVKERLAEEAERAESRKFEERSLEQWVKTASVQASDSIYQRELDMMGEERERALRNQKLDMDTYLKYVGKTEQELREEMRPMAEERVARYLVLRKLANDEGIKVSSDEINAEIETLVATSGESKVEIRRALSSEDGRVSIRTSILNRKVMHLLVDIVQGADDEKIKSPLTVDSSAAVVVELEERGKSEDNVDSEISGQTGSEEGAKPHAS